MIGIITKFDARLKTSGISTISTGTLSQLGITPLEEYSTGLTVSNFSEKILHSKINNFIFL
jgi:hypothetical protein